MQFLAPSRRGRVCTAAVATVLVAAPLAIAHASTTGVDPQASRNASQPTHRLEGHRAGQSRVVAAAGDISPRSLGHQRGTARLVQRIDPAKVLALGDLQYPRGAYADFRNYYEPTWGRFKAKTLPTPGNHEYVTPNAAGYFRYFGDAARPHRHSYYTTKVGAWRVISLDSNIQHDESSAQVRWLKRILAANEQKCTLAFWHHPRFNSGLEHGNNVSVRPLWRALYAARADLVLNGHEHVYERFARQTPAAVQDPQGIREFVAGTGGAENYEFGPVEPNSQARVAGRNGVLRLVLRPTSYSWRFVASNDDVLDHGGPVTCH
jgi:3',5'-cyclic AMP phosphodiesterase CpdA